jgi:outer membrane protein assembly factor BamB
MAVPHAFMLRLLAFIILGLGCAIPGSAAEPGTPDPLLGRWAGTVAAPQGEVAAIAFEFRAAASGPTFKLYFPAMFTNGADLGLPVETVGPGRYTIPAPFSAQLQLSGDELTGTFFAAQLPLSLRRDAPLPAKLPPVPAPAGPAPAWTYPLGIGTWAPPVADSGLIYVGGGDGRFHAVRSTDGHPLWTWSGPNPIDGAATVGPSAIYFLDTKFNLVALDRDHGVLRWRTRVHNEFLGGGSVPDNPTFNHRAARPLLHDGVLYVGSSDGGIYAIDPGTGNSLWRHDAGAPVFCTVGVHDNDTLLFGTMDGSVVLLDRHTRAEKLRVKTGGGVVTTPVVVGGRVIVGSRDYQLYAFNLRDGSVAWKYSYWFSWIESTPVLRDGLLYVGGSDYARVSAIDPASGRAKWSTVVGGMTWGSPLLTARHAFAGTVNQNLPGTLIAHQAGLVKLDRATGEIVWRIILPAAPEGQFAGYAGSLTLAGDKVIAAGFDGLLVAYPVAD